MKTLGKIATGLVVAKLALQCVSGATFYVAVDGNDGWSGRLDKVNRNRTDGPVATLAGAHDAVRRLKSKGPLTEPVHVIVADGRYELRDPLIFTAEDSGTKQCPIVYEAAPGARPVVSGGRVVTGWAEDRAGIWKAASPVANTRQLYINGRRAD
jgi:hypothetical protein